MPEGIAPKVSMRVRPFTTNEKNNGATRIVKLTDNKISLHNPTSGSIKEYSFSFDHCYFWEAKNGEVYKDIGEPLVGKALEGFNVAVVSYGQGGSGKSYTINGTMEEAGLITIVSQTLYDLMRKTANIKEYFVVVSYLEVTDDYVHDLINPSGRDLKVRNHPQLGLYVDDMAEVTVSCSDDIIMHCEQGNRIKKLISTDFTGNNMSNTIFTITIEQKPCNGGTAGTRSTFSFVDLAGSEHTSKSEDAMYVCKSLNNLYQVVGALLNKDKDVAAPYRDSKLTRLLQDIFGGNAFTSFIGHISPSDFDYTETLSSLKFCSMVKNIMNVPKRNENDTDLVVKALRDEIAQLREVIAVGTSNLIDLPNSDDVSRMEELIKDLQVAKMQTWDEKQRISEMFIEERQHHLSNKGILDMVQDSTKRDTKDIQEKIMQLQKNKERLMFEYKEKRKIVDDLKEKLQGEIKEYTSLTEQGKGNEEEGKKIVAEIHSMKEKLKEENESLKKLKINLKENQEKQKMEKEDAKTNSNALKGNMELRFKVEAEQREKLEKEHQAVLADELDRIRMETDQEKAELKIKKAENKSYAVNDVIKIELELLDLKAEKAAMAVKLRSMETEKKQLEKDLHALFKRQKEELEIQQLQHFQTFRLYREAFEDQKAALEQRYRTLLEDSIQDAVYLSSTNHELIDENRGLKQELAEMKDKLTKLNGRPTSPD